MHGSRFLDTSLIYLGLRLRNNYAKQVLGPYGFVGYIECPRLLIKTAINFYTIDNLMIFIIKSIELIIWFAIEFIKFT